MTKTYYVGLTKASNTSVKHSFLLAEDKEGAPRVRLGSREKEAAKAGQRGTIVIQSLHHGSGQHVSRDPMMYEFADGMFADKPGELRTRGELQTLTTIKAGARTRPFSRGALLYTGGISHDDMVTAIIPSGIYRVQSNMVAAEVLAPKQGTNSVFTGSWAEFGGFLYFGQADAVSTNSDYAASYNTVANSWSNNAGFLASYLTAQDQKLWRVHQDVAAPDRTISLSWADMPAATPVFSGDFDIGLSGGHQHKDLAVIGPHAVVAIHLPQTYRRGRLMAVDSSGSFTDLLKDLSPVLQYTPFLGGQLLWLAGRPRALWLSDVSSYRLLTFDAVSDKHADAGLPFGASYIRGGNVEVPSLGHMLAGHGVVTQDREIFFSVYGTFTKRDGTTVVGSGIVQAALTPEGMQSHIIATPEESSPLTNAHVMALGVGHVMSNTAYKTNYPQKNRLLHILTAEPNASNDKNSDVKLHRMEMWEGLREPLTWDTDVKFLHTSRYSTPSRTTGQMEVLRGYVTKLPADNTVVVRVYLDGASAETMNFSINSAGPFSQALPTNVIGRDIAIDFETNANGSVIIEFPWSIDYFAVPDQKDIVRLPILAGRDQLTRAGTLQKKTRAEILDTLAGICASPERWTLKWWDATPDWDVIPIDYQAADTEPDFVPGAGAAVAWLTLQRL